MINAYFTKCFNNARNVGRGRFIAMAVCLIVIISTSIATAFTSSTGRFIRFSNNADRSSSVTLNSKTVSGNIYIFTSRTDVKEISYYVNPVGDLVNNKVYSVRNFAPFDLAGLLNGVTPKAFDTKTLKNGENLISAKVTLTSGKVVQKNSYFIVANNVVIDPPPTTTSTTTTKPAMTTTVPVTTKPTTTSTTMVDHSGHTCIPGGMTAHGPCIDEKFIPSPRVGTSIVRVDNRAPITTNNGEPGAFRTRCDFSHMNYDDPVLYLNQPGKAHLHSYFGNTGTNAFSTSNSLMTTGNSTCNGGIMNRSAYWVPAMIDTSNGRPIAPNDDRSIYNSDLEIYYKTGYQGVGFKDIRSFPDGLQMIAGNSKSATGPTPGSTVKYHCESSLNTDRVKQSEGYSIPICKQGEVLTMIIGFPQCWDGVNLRSTDGRSHMAYGQWVEGYPETSLGCPASHPVGLPFLSMIVRYRVQSGDTAKWKLSSDSYTNGPGGYSGHADYVFAWPNKTFDTVVNRCYRTLFDCGYQLGDGREPWSSRIPL